VTRPSWCVVPFVVVGGADGSVVAIVTRAQVKLVVENPTTWWFSCLGFERARRAKNVYPRRRGGTFVFG
jgi:hypothetical protein